MQPAHAGAVGGIDRSSIVTRPAASRASIAAGEVHRSPPRSRGNQSRPLRRRRSAIFLSRARSAASSRSILFHTSISAACRRSLRGSMPSWRSTFSTSCNCASASLMRNVAHMQDHVGLDHLFERGAESRDQHGRQVGNEADRVGQDACARHAAGRPRASVGSSVANSMSADSTLGPRHAVEQRRFAGIGVADQRDDRIRHAPAARRDAARACV